MRLKLKDIKNLLLLKLSLNLHSTELRTPPVGDLSILWDEFGLWESIGMEKSLEKKNFA